MTRSTLRHVADSLDAPAALISVLPDLFRGLDSLGSTPGRIATLLKRHGIGPEARVLDLGCGKGAFAVALARRTGCHITGIDAFEPFVLHARRSAARRGLNRRARFLCADARRAPRTRRYDAVTMLGVLAVADAAPLLRRRTRPGGLYVIDDAVRAQTPRRPLRAVPTAEQARALLQRRGDTILREITPPPSLTARTERRIQRVLARNARRLARQRPDLASDLERFLARQRGAAATLRRDLRPTLWLVRRAEASRRP